jgi:hypothetical protein
METLIIRNIQREIEGLVYNPGWKNEGGLLGIRIANLKENGNKAKYFDMLRYRYDSLEANKGL